MNDHEKETWERIQSHQFDDPEASLAFTKRLARDNAWDLKYAYRVVDEYRRFCFFAVHAGHPVTPSDAVDQVWHLHLTYTRDYWGKFCPNVLGEALHHGPTRGGQDEDRKYRDWYGRTLASRNRYFGAPPESIWPSPERRFSAAGPFVRVDRKRMLLVDRSGVRRTLRWLAAAAFGAMATGALANAAQPSVAGWLGLGAFSVLVVAGLIWMRVLRRRKTDGRRRQDGTYVAGAAGYSNDAGKDAGSGCGSGCSSGCGAGCGG